MDDKKIPTIETEFLNIQTDFGFKYMFGTPKHKHLLIRFLNALFDGILTVKDVAYHDKEILPTGTRGKRIVYDVYCTVPVERGESPFFPENQIREENDAIEEDHHFILEMQNVYTPPFEERMVFYVSKMISGQGRPAWNYELEPVFGIAVTDFNFSRLKPKVIRDVMLVDRESGEILTNKLHLIFCSLKALPKKWENCKTEIERLLFLIKNMDSMNTASLAYRDGNYSEYFDAARSSRLDDRETITYSQSLQKLRDVQRGIEYAAEEAAKAAAKAAGEEAMKKGIEKGMENARKITAGNLKELGVDMETISKATGLSIAEIRDI